MDGHFEGLVHAVRVERFLESHSETSPVREYKIALKVDLVGQTHFLQSIQYGTMITSKLDKKALESERCRPADEVSRELAIVHQLKKIFCPFDWTCLPFPTSQSPDTWSAMEMRFQLQSVGQSP